MTTTFHPDTYRHLIVLISTDVDASASTSRIWELADATDMRVLLLGLCRNEAEEPGLRRGLAMMSAMIQIGRVVTDVKIEIGACRVDAVRRHYRPGDAIVCFTGQRAGLPPQPLSRILESKLHAPVYIFTSPLSRKPISNRFDGWLVWSGFIGIVVGVGILQIRIVQLPEDWFQSALFILSTLLEFWLIGVWNGLFH